MISPANQIAAPTRVLPHGSSVVPADAPSQDRRSGDPAASKLHLKLAGCASELRNAFANLDGCDEATQNILSTYYDTPDGHIWRRGFALRLRETSKSYELTLLQRDAGISERACWTSLLAKPVVEFGALPEDAPRAKIGVILPEELEPRFSCDVQRQTKIVTAGGAALNVSLNQGRIVAARRESPVAELKFRILSGPASDLLACVDSALRDYQLFFSPQSETSLGVGLLTGTPPATVRASKSYLDASNTIGQTVATVIAVTTEHIFGNLDAATDGHDPEGVHQLRVSLRRLRSALLIFKKHLGPRAIHLDREARRSLKLLGAARDLDVFLSETLQPVIRGNYDEPGLVHLGKIAEKRRADAYGGVRQLVSGRRFNRFLLDLLTVAKGGELVVKNVDYSLLPMARRTLTKRHKKVMAAGNDFDLLTEEQRHEVRIELKKLRYACDFFQTVFPGAATRAYLRRLADLQEHLGLLNDAAVAGQLTKDLSAGEPDAAIGAALVKGWYARGLQAIEPEMRGAWRKFARAKPFWRPRVTRDQQD